LWAFAPNLADARMYLAFDKSYSRRQKTFMSQLNRSAALTSIVPALLLWFALTWTVAPAFGELRYTTTYRQNPIRGITPAELWSGMAAHPILDEDGPALANITHAHTLTVKTEHSGESCHVKKVDFTWRFVITLPRAVDESRMDRKTRTMWGEFTAFLKSHEEHHRTIFLQCGKNFLAKAATLANGRNCSGLERKVSRFVDAQYAVCMSKQRAFDRRDRKSVGKLALRRAYRK
jgi:predicted secreted Zn-dependent protease